MDKFIQDRQDQSRMQQVLVHMNYHSQLHKGWHEYKKRPLKKGARFANHETGFEMKVDPDMGDMLVFNGEVFVAWAWKPSERSLFFSRKILTKGEKMTNKNTLKINIGSISAM